MTQDGLDFGEVLARLHSLVGSYVEVELGGICDGEPLIAYWEGSLSWNEEFGPDDLGADREAFVVSVGDPNIWLHSDQFPGAAWSDNGKARELIIRIGSIRLRLRAAYDLQGSAGFIGK